MFKYLQQIWPSVNIYSSLDREWNVTLLEIDHNPVLSQDYLNNFADDPVEKSHQLAGRQLNLLFQLVHRLMLQTNSQKKSLEDGKSAVLASRTRPCPFQNDSKNQNYALLTKAIWYKNINWQ